MKMIYECCLRKVIFHEKASYFSLLHVWWFAAFLISDYSCEYYSERRKNINRELWLKSINKNWILNVLLRHVNDEAKRLIQIFIFKFIGIHTRIFGLLSPAYQWILTANICLICHDIKMIFWTRASCAIYSICTISSQSDLVFIGLQLFCMQRRWECKIFRLIYSLIAYTFRLDYLQCIHL